MITQVTGMASSTRPPFSIRSRGYMAPMCDVRWARLDANPRAIAMGYYPTPVAGPEGSDLVPKTSAASLPARFERVLVRFEPERARGLRIPRVINPNRKAAEDGGGEPPRFSPSAAGSARAALSRTAMIFSPAFSFTVAIISSMPDLIWPT